MLTQKEYEKIATKIFDSIRGEDSDKFGKCCCDEVHCEQCPFKIGCDCNLFTSPIGLESVFKTFAILERWNKEHPPVTYEDKYEEAFGVKPVDEHREYVCPSNVGFTECVDCGVIDCDECAEKFWTSEYIPPKQKKKEKEKK